MNKVYITARYLKTFHYLFFYFSVLSMSLGIMLFDYSGVESLNFFVFAIFYSAISFLTAYYFYKDYKAKIEPIKIVKIYFVGYLIIVILTISSLVFLFLITPSILALIYSFIFINYYVLFFLILILFFSRFEFVSKIFEFYNFLNLEKARKIAMEYAITHYIESYKIGSDPKIDEILDDILAHKDYPLPYVRKFEIAICEKRLVEVNRLLEKIGKNIDPITQKIKKSLEESKELYLQKIKELEEKID